MNKDLYAETFEELHGEKLEEDVAAGSRGEVFVIGRSNPGIDSVASAIALADIKNTVDVSRNYTACAAGKMDAAARFALSYFECEAPVVLERVDSGAKVILVAHNEKVDAAPGAEDADILELVDNHALHSLRTGAPLYVRCEPRGATSTIIYSMYKEEEEGINKKVAGLLCAAIIYETKMFTTDNTTQADKLAAMDLANLAGLELQSFSQEILAFV